LESSENNLKYDVLILKVFEEIMREKISRLVSTEIQKISVLIILRSPIPMYISAWVWEVVCT